MIKNISQMTEDEKQEYTDFLKGHERCNFQQSIEWANVKTSWEKYLLFERDEKENLIGTILFWVRKLPVFGKLAYISRGPTISESKLEYFPKMIEELKDFCKKNKIFAVIFEPDVKASNKAFRESFEKVGFEIHGENKEFADQINPCYVFRLNLKDKTMDELLKEAHSKTRYNIRYAKRKGIEVYEGKKEDLHIFYDILETTGQRDEFSIHSQEYYEKVLNSFDDENIKLIFAKHEEDILSGLILITYGNKAWYLYGASSNVKRNLMPNYLMQWEAIEYSKNKGCEIYDFMGTPGLDENDPEHKKHPDYGLYRFKKGFNAEFTEFMGQLILKINPLKTNLYKVAERIYKKNHKLINKLFKF